GEAAFGWQPANRERLWRSAGASLHRGHAGLEVRSWPAARSAHHARRSGREESGEMEFALLWRGGGALVSEPARLHKLHQSDLLQRRGADAASAWQIQISRRALSRPARRRA